MLQRTWFSCMDVLASAPELPWSQCDEASWCSDPVVVGRCHACGCRQRWRSCPDLAEHVALAWQGNMAKSARDVLWSSKLMRERQAGGKQEQTLPRPSQCGGGKSPPFLPMEHTRRNPCEQPTFLAVHGDFEAEEGCPQVQQGWYV